MSTQAVSTRAFPARRSLELTLTALILVLIAAVFWSGQRYPSLLKKLHTGTALEAKGALSFDALLPTNPAMSLPARVARTGVNWLWTNRFGMAFAIPFGAAAMTLAAQTARPRRFGSASANVICGAVAGAPMGVCTNCATPIGQGLLLGGASSRLTVAAMLSSPSFNPVVLAMAFTLFPLPTAVCRAAVPLALLGLLPLLVPETAAPQGIAMPRIALPLSARLRSLGALYARNVLRVTLATLPWMLLAALLGALTAELVPRYGTHIPVSFWGVAAVAALGTILPVPMAFDVGLAFVLLRSGIPLPYAAALLCTLGPVSLYSLTALAKQLGRAPALRLTGATALLGTVVGWLAL